MSTQVGYLDFESGIISKFSTCIPREKRLGTPLMNNTLILKLYRWITILLAVRDNKSKSSVCTRRIRLVVSVQTTKEF